MLHIVPKDIDLIIYRFIHRDLMKLVNQEYHSKLIKCSCKDIVCKNVCKECIYISSIYGKPFNYRQLNSVFHCTYIYNLKNKARGPLPINY